MRKRCSDYIYSGTKIYTQFTGNIELYICSLNQVYLISSTTVNSSNAEMHIKKKSFFHFN